LGLEPQGNIEDWFNKEEDLDDNVMALIQARVAAKKVKNWAQADDIRKTLLEAGIILEDKPDGTTDWRRA
jgi:cysteinyl-tRNA synthetase